MPAAQCTNTLPAESINLYVSSKYSYNYYVNESCISIYKYVNLSGNLFFKKLPQTKICVIPFYYKNSKLLEASAFPRYNLFSNISSISDSSFSL